VTLAVAASVAVVAGCANLGALECQGSCADASQEAAGPEASAADAGEAESPEASAGDGGIPGILCAPGSDCTPSTQECCLGNSGSTSCTQLGGCGQGTDIECDDPGQCGTGGNCWICVTGQGLQGTSCNYQGDIVGQWGCNASNARQLCHSTSQCEAGTCKPFPVMELDAGQGMTWMSACQ
jgi:hypothetical protein